MAHHASLRHPAWASRTTSSDASEWLAAEILLEFYMGRLVPGDRLPAVREVAERLSVSPRTALEIYKALENEGIVESRQRSGVFLRQLGVEVERGAREAALFKTLRYVAGRLGVLGVQPGDFIRLLQLTWGARRREDLKFAFITHHEAYEIFSCELRRKLAFDLPAMVLPPQDEREARACLARDRLVSCLLATSLYAPLALELAREYNLRMIVLRLDKSAADLLEPPLGITRCLVMRDADTARALTRLVSTLHGGQRARRIRVIHVDDPAGPAATNAEGVEIYASPLCLGLARARYGASKTIRPLPHALSRETVDDILFQYLFAPSRAAA